MPTVLTWPYKGPGCELNEIQRVVPGDNGNDDLLGEVTIIGMEGADLIIEDGTVDDSGKAVTRLRTSWHIQALQQKEAVAVREPTGRPGQWPGGMIAFLGLGGLPVVHGKWPASNAKGLGGKAPTAPHSNRTAIAPHRTAPHRTAESSSLAQLGVQYADSDNEGEKAPAAEPKKASKGTVGYRGMEKEEQLAYKKARYEIEKVGLQSKMAAKFVWLKCELKPKTEEGKARGWHCVVCIDSRWAHRTLTTAHPQPYYLRARVRPLTYHH